MAVRSRGLAHVNGTAGGVATTLFTVPAGRTAIVREIVLRNRGATAATLSVFVRRSSVTISVARRTLASQEVAEITGRALVLEPFDDLQVVASAEGTLYSLSASGSLLLGAPE